MVGTYGLNRWVRIGAQGRSNKVPVWKHIRVDKVLSVKTDLYTSNCFKNPYFLKKKKKKKKKKKIEHSISLTNCEIDQLVVEFTLVPTEIHIYP